MNETIINFIAAVGGSTLISSTLTFLFTKRKYSAETDSVEIMNLKESIGVYKKIIDDLKEHVNYLELQQTEMRDEFNSRISNIRTGLAK